MISHKVLVCSLAVLCLALSPSVYVTALHTEYPNDEGEACSSSWFGGTKCRYPCSCNANTQRCDSDLSNVHKTGLLRAVSDQKDSEQSVVFAVTHALDDRRLIYSEKRDNGGRKPLVASEQTSLRYFLECSGKVSNAEFMRDHQTKSTYTKVLPTEKDYPYNKVDRVDCETKSGVTVKDNCRYNKLVYSGDEEQLEAHVLTYGPTVVRIKAHATMFVYPSYTGQIETRHYRQFKGQSDLGEHYVEIVGIEAGSHFVIKNSWGETWGDKGYWKVNIEHFRENYYTTERTSGKKTIPMITNDIKGMIPAGTAIVERRENQFGRNSHFNIPKMQGDELKKYMESADEDHDIAKLKAALRIVQQEVNSKGGHVVVALHHADVTLVAGRKFYISVITRRAVPRKDIYELYLYAAHVWIPFPGYGSTHGFKSVYKNYYEDAEADGGRLYYHIQPDESVGAKKGMEGFYLVRNTAKRSMEVVDFNRDDEPEPKDELRPPPTLWQLAYSILAGSVGVFIVWRSVSSRSLTPKAQYILICFVGVTSLPGLGKIGAAFSFFSYLYARELSNAFFSLGHTVIALFAPFTGPVDMIANMLLISPTITVLSLGTLVAFLTAVITDDDTRWELVTFFLKHGLIVKRVRDEFANWSGFTLFPQKRKKKEKVVKQSKRNKILGPETNFVEKESDFHEEQVDDRHIKGD